MAQARIGISGWRYGPWRGTFYPNDLQQRRELEYASRRLNSIEVAEVARTSWPGFVKRKGAAEADP